MTELYLVELWAYLDARIELLNDPESAQLRTHVSRMWSNHFTHESGHPNLFPTERVKEVWGTQFVPVHWADVAVSGEEDL